MNLQQEQTPKDLGTIEHHPAHAIILSRYLAKQGVRHRLYVYGDGVQTEGDIDYPVREFLVDHLR